MPGVGRTSILLPAAGGHGRAGKIRTSLRQLLEVGGPPKRSLLSDLRLSWELRASPDQSEGTPPCQTQPPGVGVGV